MSGQSWYTGCRRLIDKVKVIEKEISSGWRFCFFLFVSVNALKWFESSAGLKAQGKYNLKSSNFSGNAIHRVRLGYIRYFVAFSMSWLNTSAAVRIIKPDEKKIYIKIWLHLTQLSIAFILYFIWPLCLFHILWNRNNLCFRSCAPIPGVQVSFVPRLILHDNFVIIIQAASGYIITYICMYVNILMCQSKLIKVFERWVG